MLFSRTRCPGKLACADPMIYRSWMIPSEDPDDTVTAEAKAHLLKIAHRSYNISLPVGKLGVPKGA